MSKKRTVFFVSDRTGISVQTLGHTLISQFEQIDFRRINVPFIDSPEKALEIVKQIDDAYKVEGAKPLVFSTLVDDATREALKASQGVFYDFFETYVGSLEAELGEKASPVMGKTHGVVDGSRYLDRMEAINYSLIHDDGATVKHLDDADIILIGVSRCGKTPTCIYLSMQYGVCAANFPLTEDDLEEEKLPKTIRDYRHKLFGLTIDPGRIQSIREQRRPNSRYSSLRQCQYEVRQAKRLYERMKVPYIDTTARSIEEIAATIVAETKLQTRMF